MNNYRKKLDTGDQEKILITLLHYKKLHEDIAELEQQIRELQDKKDLMLTDLQLSRADETLVLANFESKYGPGKLDIMTLEWVSEKQTVEDESIERI